MTNEEYGERHPEQCQHSGCTEKGIDCSLNDDEDTVEYFCAAHCYEHGYCFGCGNFWSGNEDFDFNNPSHLCANCRTDNAEDEEEAASYYEPPPRFLDDEEILF